MTPPRFFIRFMTIPAHLGLALRWDSPRTAAAARHAPYVLALRPVHLFN